jgi:hypothetical protein
MSVQDSVDNYDTPLLLSEVNATHMGRNQTSPRLWNSNSIPRTLTSLPTPFALPSITELLGGALPPTIPEAGRDWRFTSNYRQAYTGVSLPLRENQPERVADDSNRPPAVKRSANPSRSHPAGLAQSPYASHSRYAHPTNEAYTPAGYSTPEPEPEPQLLSSREAVQYQWQPLSQDYVPPPTRHRGEATGINRPLMRHAQPKVNVETSRPPSPPWHRTMSATSGIFRKQNHFVGTRKKYQDSHEYPMPESSQATYWT